MPRSLRAASIRGPTPGSSVTGRERRSVRVVLSGSLGPAPALEVGHAIRPRTDVGTDDAAYLGDELLLHAEPLGELGEQLGGGDVPEVQGTTGLRRGFDRLGDSRHLTLASAGPLVRDHLAVLDAQDRPDVERRPDQPPRPPDATALRQVLQRAHGEEQVAPPDGGLRLPPDLLELPALVYTAEGLAQDQTRPHLGALGVEHLHRPLDQLRRGHGRGVGAADLLRHRQDQDVVVGVERLVGLDERPRRRLGSGGELVCSDQPLVEVLVGHVDLVSVGLVGAEVEGQRHDADLRTLEHPRWQARGRVRYYRGSHSATICSGYSGCPPSRTSTSIASSRSRIPWAILWSATSSSSLPRSNVTTSAPPLMILFTRLNAASSTLPSTTRSSPSRKPMYAPWGTSSSPTLASRTARVTSALNNASAISRISSSTSSDSPSGSKPTIVARPAAMVVVGTT